MYRKYAIMTITRSEGKNFVSRNLDSNLQPICFYINHHDDKTLGYHVERTQKAALDTKTIFHASVYLHVLKRFVLADNAKKNMRN